MSQEIEKKVVEEQNFAIVEIAKNKKQFETFIDAYDEAVKTITKKLKKGRDYGYPFEPRNKQEAERMSYILYYRGAYKLATYANLVIKEINEEAIERNGEFWGYKIKLTLGSKSREVTAVGIASYTERKMWNRDLTGKYTEKKDEHFLYQMAFKRAYVKAVILYFGIVGDFVEETYEAIHEEPKEPPREYFYIPPEKIITSHFLKPQDYQEILNFLNEGEKTNEEISFFIQSLIPKRNKENLLNVARVWANVAGEPEPASKTTEKDLRAFIEKCRNKLIQGFPQFAQVWNGIQFKLKKEKVEKRTTLEEVEQTLEKLKELETKEGESHDSDDELDRLFK